ncbi:MAG: A24 family peptidase [Hyphomicrobium sp.]
MATAIIGLSGFALPMAEAFVAIALGLAMLAITATDLAEFRIPDWLSLPAICAGLLASGRFLNPNTDDLIAYPHAIAAVMGGGSLWAIAALYARLRGHDGLGFGDVKLAAAAGAWVGPDLLSLVVLLASSSALVAVLGTAWLRGQPVDLKGRVPFGAFLAPSIWIVWVIAATGLAT